MESNWMAEYNEGNENRQTLKAEVSYANVHVEIVGFGNVYVINQPGSRMAFVDEVFKSAGEAMNWFIEFVDNHHEELEDLG